MQSNYQNLIKCSLNTQLVKFLPRRADCKGSQGKKTADTPVADVDVSKVSDSEPTNSRRVVNKKVTISKTENIIPDLNVTLELGKSINLTEVAEEEAARQVLATHARIKTASRRVVNKKVTISTTENIIPDLNVTLELGKSINLTEVTEEEAARQVLATHARIVTESVSKKSFDPSQKLKGVQSLTLEEQEVKAIKPAEDSHVLEAQVKELGRIPRVLDESTVVYATSSEGTRTKPGVSLDIYANLYLMASFL
nr:hypothetical protein [Tanacetum cinerariifolium]